MEQRFNLTGGDPNHFIQLASELSRISKLPELTDRESQIDVLLGRVDSMLSFDQYLRWLGPPGTLASSPKSWRWPA